MIRSFTGWRQLLVVGAGTLVSACSEFETLDAGFAKTSDELSFTTPNEKMPATTYFTRHGSAQYAYPHVLAAATYNTLATHPEHMMLATSDTSAPFTLRIHKIAATPADPLFGKKLSSIPTWCSGGVPCGSETGLTDSTTLRYSTKGDYALFGYGGDQANVLNGEVGTTSARVMRVHESLTHDAFPIHECLAALGSTLLCRVNGPTLSSSNRNDGTDRALVSYLLEPNVSINNWQIASKLMSPTGVMTTLSSVSACSYSPCKVGGVYPFIESAYNKQANKFLVVTLINSLAPVQASLRGQIYDGTTGALGATVDFGVFPQLFVQLGIASNPDPTANPDQEWMVRTNTQFGSGGTFYVRPNGSFDPAVPTGVGQEVGLWTLQWANAADDGTHYEYLHDTAVPPSPVDLTRFRHDLSGTVTYDVTGMPEAFAESLAFGRGARDIAVWSAYGCTTGGSGSVCGDHIFWRFMSR